MSKVSEWQDGFPPCEGVWEIYVSEHAKDGFNGIYHARFKDGMWSAGADLELWPEMLDELNFDPYESNNDPSNPRKWRGLIDD